MLFTSAAASGDGPLVAMQRLLLGESSRRLSSTQSRIAWAILPKFSATMSMISSFFLARDVALKWHEKESVSLTNAMLFGISLNDIIGTFFSFFMTTWMIPRGQEPFAVGNQGTCDAQGFFTTFHFIYFVTAYTLLGMLYWLIVQRGWSDDVMKKWKIRLAFCLPPPIFSLGFAVPPLFYGMYNDGRIHCTLIPYPKGCLIHADIECTRGENAIIPQIVTFAYALVCNLVIVVFMLLIVYAVYSKEKRCDRYNRENDTERRRASRKYTRKSAWQGLRYTGAFIVSYVWLYIFMGLNSASLRGQLVKESDSLVVQHQVLFDTFFYFYCILTPLMGFFNALIYFRNKYVSYRGQHPEMSKMDSLCHVLQITNRCHCMKQQAGGKRRDDAGKDGGTDSKTTSPSKSVSVDVEIDA